MFKPLPQMPQRPVIGYRGLAEVLGRSIEALKVAKQRGRLPLHAFRLAQVLVFDLDEVLEFKAAYRGVRGPSKRGQE